MTATERLRELLDERGVEYTICDSEYAKETCWAYMGELMAAFVEYEDGTTRFELDHWGFTLEQAVEATLGRGTCRSTSKWTNVFKCSECGFEYDFITDPYQGPHYCPHCGRKAVVE